MPSWKHSWHCFTNLTKISGTGKNERDRGGGDCINWEVCGGRVTVIGVMEFGKVWGANATSSRGKILKLLDDSEARNEEMLGRGTGLMITSTMKSWEMAKRTTKTLKWTLKGELRFWDVLQFMLSGLFFAICTSFVDPVMKGLDDMMFKTSNRKSYVVVFHCVSATCGYFYHPECVAKLLHPMDDAVAEELQKRIFAGESFTCPAHKCHKCKQREDKDILGLQFAVCRRCPKAYHRKCLPRYSFVRVISVFTALLLFLCGSVCECVLVLILVCMRKIAFEDLEEEDITTRAWDGLLPNNRVLIYCLKHEIDETLGTPIRNHITFPGIEEKKKSHPSDLQLRKGKAVTERRFSDTEELPKKKPFSEKDFESTEKPLSRKHLRDGGSSTSVRKKKFSGLDRTRVSSKEGRPNPQLIKGFEPVKSNQKEVTGNKFEGTINEKRKKKGKENKLKLRIVEVVGDRSKFGAALEEDKGGRRISPINFKTYQQRLMAMMEKKASSITLEDVVKRHKVPSTHSYSLKTVVDKNITQGKVEGFTEAVRIALKKLEEGGTVEDAKAVCGPEILNHIIKWKNKLRVYLAPFLHGMRYTSFGRHFTKVDKLKEVREPDFVF
ncbi:hypothetical protein IFM89_013411 [Coptis chinensis]|uniref:Histone-lysine N-methyltransferase NSD-like PHD zinc finger domain-containing protein n=1 Tax=Coptis chinensis TaxID=261450 RepID=A0A835GX84_9MAGN|nr:hypothetical protein IFM89_013411 [Coptis chinensis]